MPSTSATPPRERSHPDARAANALERRYGSIGISAVAAAARFAAPVTGKDTVAKAPVLDPRFEEAST